MKNKRHEAILEIIRTKDITTQEELQGELRNRGFEVTQATVSREYSVAESNKNQETERLMRVLQDSILNVDSAQNILVIKTQSGMAMAAAAAIDNISYANIMGCIAGDDTIIAVFKTSEDALNSCMNLRHDLRL